MHLKKNRFKWKINIKLYQKPSESPENYQKKGIIIH